MPTTHHRHTCHVQRPQRVREAKAPCLRQATLQYPSLHFEAYAVKGRNNQLAHPIYLPKLSTSPESVKTVGGTQDVILKIPGIDGFQMKVKANSVTFPDGSRVGTLIISPVTADRLPMSPPAGGAQFGIPAWTIQPAGTRFDPPIEVTLPNTRAFPAGDNIPVVQWDHDLAQYVPMGRATVSEDGAVLITDSGSGLTKAGWGGACVYDPDKCGKDKPKCDRKECLEEDNSGDCPTCKFTQDKNRTELRSIGGSGGIDLSNVLGPKFKRVIFSAADTFLYKLIPGGEAALAAVDALLSFKLSFKGQGKETEECCFVKKSKVKSLEVGGSLELEWDLEEAVLGKKIPLSGFSEQIIGAIFSAKLSGSGSAKFKEEGCPDDPANGLTGSGSVELGVAGSVFIGSKIIDKTGKLREKGDDLLVIGGEGSITGTGKIDITSQFCARASVDLKASIPFQIGFFKLDVMPLEVPLLRVGENGGACVSLQQVWGSIKSSL